MRKYELTIVWRPDISEEEKQVEILKSDIEKLKGKIEKTDKWGKKQLSYPIKKAKEGIYYLLEVEFPEDGVIELGKKLRLNEKILRYLLVRIEEKKPSYAKASAFADRKSATADCRSEGQKEVKK